jgi:hypothetical protein
VCQGPVLIHSLIGVYSHYSYRKRDIEQLLGLTNSFTWEELPTRDPDSGNLTKAGYIPIIQDLTKYMIVFLLAFNITQGTVHKVKNHDMYLTSWYPFDVSVSPMYEIANFTQVIFNEQLYYIALNRKTSKKTAIWFLNIQEIRFAVLCRIPFTFPNNCFFQILTSEKAFLFLCNICISVNSEILKLRNVTFLSPYTAKTFFLYLFPMVLSPSINDQENMNHLNKNTKTLGTHIMQ